MVQPTYLSYRLMVMCLSSYLMLSLCFRKSIPVTDTSELWKRVIRHWNPLCKFQLKRTISCSGNEEGGHKGHCQVYEHLSQRWQASSRTIQTWLLEIIISKEWQLLQRLFECPRQSEIMKRKPLSGTQAPRAKALTRESTNRGRDATSAGSDHSDGFNMDAPLKHSKIESLNHRNVRRITTKGPDRFTC